MRLQRVINYAARFVLHLPKRASISSALRELGWLPMELRIEFKLLLVTFSTLNTGLPASLHDALHLLAPSTTRIQTRSSSDPLQLFQGRTRSKLGDRSFSVSAACVWNKIPLNIRQSKNKKSFKSACKDHLLTLSVV